MSVMDMLMFASQAQYLAQSMGEGWVEAMGMGWAAVRWGMEQMYRLNLLNLLKMARLNLKHAVQPTAPQIVNPIRTPVLQSQIQTKVL